MTNSFEWDLDKDLENQRDEVIRIIGAGYWRKGRRAYEQAHQIFQ